jgi:hypothetical protein
MIDPFNIWQSTFDKLDKATTPAWAPAMANWYGERIQAISPDPSVLTAVGFVFVFNPAPMISVLARLTPGPAAVGAQQIADAWFAAISAIVYPAGIAVGPGTVYGSPSPATTFSSIISVLINPASIAAGKAKIISALTSAKPSAEANSSQFPKALNDATLQLKMDITGLNTIAPTPAPLAAIGVPLI